MNVTQMTDEQLDKLENDLLVIVDRQGHRFHNAILGASPRRRQLDEVQRERMRRALAQLAAEKAR